MIDANPTAPASRIPQFKRPSKRYVERLFALVAIAALLIGCAPVATPEATTGATSTSELIILDQGSLTPESQPEVQPEAQLPTPQSALVIAASTDIGADEAELAVEGGPVPPIAPASVGEHVRSLEPTEIFLPSVSSVAESATGTIPSGTVPDASADVSADAAVPNPLVVTPAGPSFNWGDTENFLILGTDRRGEGGSWRTDSIMIVGLDRTNSRAAVFSIPRDLYVEIPGYGWGRINQADYMGERREVNGGPALVGSVLEDALGIPTQHWVRIQMDGFVSFVDALGGVTIQLDCPFSEPIFNLTTQQWDNFTLPAGENHLDGDDAYWFARLRLVESDIGRSSRQRAIIWALRDQILSTNALLRLPELYTAFNDTITTDLGLLDIVGLAQTALSLSPENVRAGGLTLRDVQNYTTAAGAQVLVIGNAAHVRNVVESVWDAPAMADAYRGRVAGCPEVEAAPVDAPPPTPEPEGEPVVESTAPIVDPVSGQSFDPATGFPIDPETGLPVDPATGQSVEPTPPAEGG